MKLNTFLNISPLFWIMQMHERIFVIWQKTLKMQGITFTESLILSAIYFERDEVRPSDLAKLLKTSLPNISQCIRHFHRNL